MEFIEFVEKFVELKNINLLPYQKEVIKQISQAIKEGKEIKIYCLASYGESFYKELLETYYKELLEAYYKELKGMKVNRVSKLKRKNTNFIMLIDEIHEVPVFLKKKMNIDTEKEVKDDDCLCNKE